MRLLGGVREQAMPSVLVEANKAQATSVAVRWASSRVAPEAVRQRILPLNSMQTSQLKTFKLIVENRRYPTKANVPTIAKTLFCVDMVLYCTSHRNRYWSLFR